MLGTLRLGKDVIIAPLAPDTRASVEWHCDRCWATCFVFPIESLLAVDANLPVICEPCADVVERELRATR